MNRHFVWLLALAASMSSQGQDPGPARASLERFSQGLERLHARFSQTVTAPDGSPQEQGEGAIWMQRPDLFRWRYGGEFPELIVADGERIWLYDEALEQVTVREQSGMTKDSPMFLITDLSDLDRQFTMRELGDSEGMLLLELTVNDQDAEFERVLIGLREDELVLMALEDAFGMRTEIHFAQIERNPKIEAGLFTFTPPDGVDVIGDPLE